MSPSSTIPCLTRAYRTSRSTLDGSDRGLVRARQKSRKIFREIFLPLDFVASWSFPPSPRPIPSAGCQRRRPAEWVLGIGPKACNGNLLGPADQPGLTVDWRL